MGQGPSRKGKARQGKVGARKLHSRRSSWRRQERVPQAHLLHLLLDFMGALLMLADCLIGPLVDVIHILEYVVQLAAVLLLPSGYDLRDVLGRDEGAGSEVGGRGCSHGCRGEFRAGDDLVPVRIEAHAAVTTHAEAETGS